MKQFPDNKLISGNSKIPMMNTTKRAGLGLWDFQSYHTSSDTSLFSSSLPVLPHEKLIINDCVDDRQSIDDSAAANSHKFHDDVAGEDSLEDIAKQTIGFLLPDNEDELFAGIIDYDTSGIMPSQLEESEEADIFDSVGGMELGNDMPDNFNLSMAKMNLLDVVLPNGMVHYAPSSAAATVAGEHPFGEHPSRTLFVRNINSNVEDTELRSLFEQYGDIRTLYTACKHRGFVMISYYDIRDARAAMRALQNKPLRRRKLDIHFSIPKDNPSEKDINQGTLVVFNLDPSVSNEDLLQIFGAYGEVKEIRETPHKRHHKFIEFYDVRAAEAALRALNRSDIAGKRIKLEPSRPGGTRRSLLLQMNQELEGDDSRAFRNHVGSPVANSPPGTWMQFNSPVEHGPMHTLSRSPGYRTLSPSTSNLPGLASILHSQASNSLKIAPIGKDMRGGHIDHIFSSSADQRSNFYQPHSLPELKLGHLSNNISSFGASTSNGSGIETLSGPQFLWGSSNKIPEKPKANAWPDSSGGHSVTFGGPGQSFPYPPNRQSSFMGSSQNPHPHHVGSAPPGIHFQRQFGFFPESPETSIMKPGAFGGLNLGGRSNGSYMMNVGAPRPTMHDVLGGNVAENGSSPSYGLMSSPRLSPIFLGNGPYSGLNLNGGGEGERGRARRVESNANQMESKKQFQLDLEKISIGEDNRTTLMIKNIPNKYTSKMLLAAIDENHKGTYDFLYLPIDFKNKCNVGYAFINMLSPSHIIPFYQAFNGKKWEKFNSEKVASLAYARIQGRSALIAHFQNSSLMNEDKRCRPILFHSESTDSGEQIIQEHLPSTGMNSQVHAPNDSGGSEESHTGTINKSVLEGTPEKA